VKFQSASYPAIRCKPSLRFVSLRFVRGFPLLSGIHSAVDSLLGFSHTIEKYQGCIGAFFINQLGIKKLKENI
jgi:hypothetical protein